MATRRRIGHPDGQAALAQWRSAGAELGRSELALAVRYTLEELATRFPGRSVEVRVPPWGAVQCLEGPRHSRGTPPNVVETDAQTWLALADGQLDWQQARESGAVRASGSRAELGEQLPLWPG